MKRTILLVLMMLSLPLVAVGADYSWDRYWKVLKRTVKTGTVINGISLNSVDYSALTGAAQRPDSDYSLLLKELREFDTAQLKTREEKLAFWINVYNIGAIKTIVDHYPVESIRSKKINWLGLPWSRKAITIGSKDYSLAEIENDILLDGFKELRIHFGINCASVSCADLSAEPYRAATLFAQLEEQGHRLLANRKKGLLYDRDRKTLFLSQIFKFDKKHFDALGGGAPAFIKPYLTAQDSLEIASAGVRVEYLDYDWKANDTKNAQ